MPTRKPSSIHWIGVAVMAVLVLAYVGAYYAMVQPLDLGRSKSFAVYSDLGPFAPDEEIAAENRRVTVFAPIHWLDRRIRSRVWEPPIEPQSEPGPFGSP